MPTVAELKKEAKSRGLKGYSKLLKAELDGSVCTTSPPQNISVKYPPSCYSL